MFGLTTNGTNPDALLIIELHEPITDANASDSPSAGRWHYALSGMTQGGLSVRLDDKEVWSKTYERGPADFANWLWFRDFAKAADEPKK